MNLVGFETQPQDKSLSAGGEVSLLCSVTGAGLKKLSWVRSDYDSGMYDEQISSDYVCYLHDRSAQCYRR